MQQEMPGRRDIRRSKKAVSAIGKTDYVAEGHKLPSYTIDTAKCIKCGVCMENCKRAKAISKG